ERYVQDVQVDQYLPKLYTWNILKGRYEQILNKRGGLTKNYPGGIYLQQFQGRSATPSYLPVHKPKAKNVQPNLRGFAKNHKQQQQRVVKISVPKNKRGRIKKPRIAKSSRRRSRVVRSPRRKNR
ncbi:5732_t:CDS:1, partial [Scutellospora calospora]